MRIAMSDDAALRLRKAALARRAGHYEEAEAIYREWIADEPRNPGPRYGLALLLLRRGDFARGWPLYEARKFVPELGLRVPTFSFSEWQGDQIGSLLLWPEQGLGDQIMFARYVPQLLNAKIRVTLVASPSLTRLFSALGCDVISAVGTVNIPRHDAWCLVGSLPLRLGSIPTEPYFPSTTSGSGVGVMVAGNPMHVNDRDRSLPPEEAKALLARGRNLAPEATGAKDFFDTARIIDELERVVTVDTSVAHLAGAMGKPTEILLGRDPDWRWGLSETRTIWYPSATLVRR